MKELDKLEFFKSVSAMNASYSKSLDEVMLTSWWECMKEYSLEDIKRALILHAGTIDGGFAPKPCHIIKQLKPNDRTVRDATYIDKKSEPMSW